VIPLGQLMDFVIMKLEHVSVVQVTMVQSVINVYLVTMVILDVDHVSVTMLEVNLISAMQLCVVVMNLDSVNAR